VLLHKDTNHTVEVFFDCMAVVEDEAMELAQEKYPDAEEIVLVWELEEGDPPISYVVFSDIAMSTDDESGFWHSAKGWVSLERAERFSQDDVDDLPVPPSDAQDARWMLHDTAEMMLHHRRGRTLH